MTDLILLAGVAVEAGLSPEGQALFDDPKVQLLALIAIVSYVIGRSVIGPRDPRKPRKWWDMRRID